MRELLRFSKKMRQPDSDGEMTLEFTQMTVQQALYKWYSVLKVNSNNHSINIGFFPFYNEEDKINSLLKDIDRVPMLLMEEFVSKGIISDKEQYVRIVQALLVNLSDEIYYGIIDSTVKDGLREVYLQTCLTIQKTLNFLRHFFYQYFDVNHRIPRFCQSQFRESTECQFKNLPAEVFYSLFVNENVSLSYQQVDYLQLLIRQSGTTLPDFTETQLREFLIANNFNTASFAEREIEILKNECTMFESAGEKVLFLEKERIRFSNARMKSNICFDITQPSIRKQICDWVTDEIKQIESEERNAVVKESGILPECKIQTTLSVAKLAVLIRLLVVDKIIINHPVAPALKTTAKMFTTLQKDEISFGSLETKYHAPDKATINAVKEMLGKWINILGKL